MSNHEARITGVEWTDAEREALETIQYGSYRAADDARTTLARLVAAREAQAAARALREAATSVSSIIGLVGDSSPLSDLASWLRERADEIEREGDR